VAARYAPRWYPASTSRLLTRRMYISLQLPSLTGSRTPVSPPRPTGGRRRAGTLPRHYFRPLAVTWMIGIPSFPIIGHSSVVSFKSGPTTRNQTTVGPPVCRGFHSALRTAASPAVCLVLRSP
jgi:hypothetical protein